MTAGQKRIARDPPANGAWRPRAWRLLPRAQGPTPLETPTLAAASVEALASAAAAVMGVAAWCAAARVEAGAAAVMGKAIMVSTAAAAGAGAPLQRGPSPRGRGRGGLGAFSSGACSHGVAQECAAKESDCDLADLIAHLHCLPSLYHIAVSLSPSHLGFVPFRWSYSCLVHTRRRSRSSGVAVTRGASDSMEITNPSVWKSYAHLGPRACGSQLGERWRDADGRRHAKTGKSRLNKLSSSMRSTAGSARLLAGIIAGVLLLLLHCAPVRSAQSGQNELASVEASTPTQSIITDAKASLHVLRGVSSKHICSVR